MRNVWSHRFSCAPVFNEEVLVREFYQRVVTVILIGEPWELVIVDDGSRDQTPEELDRIQAERSDHVIVVHFARNFGHQLAITAGWTMRGACGGDDRFGSQDPRR